MARIGKYTFVIRAVDCPSCGMKAGWKCYSSSMAKTVPHVPRVAAFKKLLIDKKFPMTYDELFSKRTIDEELLRKL